MAIINFTAADALQTKVVEAGIYPSMISKLEGPTKSSSGKSYNYFVDIMISSGPYKGKTHTVVFNSESNSPSLLGEMQFYPTAYFLQVEAAILGKDVVPEDHKLDTDNLLDKPFDASWGVATVEGHLINIINGFHPAGYGAGAPAF
jgi:hypothetical protein